MIWTQQLWILGEIALAMILGGVIGFERELAEKPAGMRTHMLIAGAAALLASIGDAILNHPGHYIDDPSIRSDPLRIIEAIITGISFIGAGTIIRGDRSHAVEGLTTAASILFSAAIGICVARRLMVLSVGVTLLAIAVLRGLVVVERRMAKRHG